MASKERRVAERIIRRLSGDFSLTPGIGGIDQKRAPDRHELGKIERLAYAKDQGLRAPSAKSWPKRAQSAPGCRRPVETGTSLAATTTRNTASGDSLHAFGRPQTAYSMNSYPPLSSAGSRSKTLASGRDSRQNGFGSIAPRKCLLLDPIQSNKEYFPLAPGQYDISLGSIHWRRDLESNQSQQYLSMHKTVPVYSFGKPQYGKPNTAKGKTKGKDANKYSKAPGPGYYTLPDPWALPAPESRCNIKGTSFSAMNNTEGESRFGNAVMAAKDMAIL